MQKDEIVHVLEGTELYDVLATAVKNYATTKGEWDSRLKSTAELYSGISEDAEGELVANLIGDYLFTDSKFLERLSVEHQNLFQRLWSEVKYLCRIATAGSKEARQLEKVKKAFEDAYRNTKPAEKNTDTESDGVKYVLNENVDITYDSLISKPNMSISVVKTSLEDVKNLSREDIVDTARKNLSSKKDSRGVITIYNPDTGKDIQVGKAGLQHGLNRNYEYTAMVTLNLESYLENAIKINEAIADENRKHDSDILLGYGETITGDKIPAYFVISKLTTGVGELTEFGSLYSINAKKIAEDSTQGSSGFQSRTSATISISELLNIVNSVYSDILPKSVIDYYGVQRRRSKLGKSVVYSLSDNESASVGDYNVYGRDVKLASDEVAPVQKKQPKTLQEEFEDDMIKMRIYIFS